jgi:endonuclease/exonuclease/phosphatase (EEP) superfamily protein YafD
VAGKSPASDGKPAARPLWHWLLLVATLPCLAVIVVGQTASWWWYGELCCHWTLHASVGLIPAMLVFGRDGRWGRAFLLILALGLAPWIRAAYEPRAVLAPAPAATAVCLRVAEANLYYYNHERDAALAAIAAQEPDLVALAEVKSQDRQALAHDPRWPHQAWSEREDLFDLALLSKHRIFWSQVDHAGLIEALIDLGDGPLRVFVIHPFSPMTRDSLARRDRQYRMLVKWLAEPRPPAGMKSPVLVLGDLNLTVGAPMWRAVQTATDLKRAPGAEPATYPSWLGPLGIGIDQILARDAGLEDLRAFGLPGSDHRGLTAMVVVPMP